MTETKIIEFIHTPAEVNASLKEIIKGLPENIEITNLEDMARVDEAVKGVVKFSNKIKASALQLRRANIDENNQIISLEKEALKETSIQEKYLKGLQKQRDEALVLESRKALIPERRNELKEFNYEISDDELIRLDNEQWKNLILKLQQAKVDKERADLEKQKAFELGKKIATGEYQEELKKIEIQKGIEVANEIAKVKKEEAEKKAEFDKLEKDRKDKEAKRIKEEEDLKIKIADVVKVKLNQLGLTRDQVKMEKDGDVIKLYQLVAQIKI